VIAVIADIGRPAILCGLLADGYLPTAICSVVKDLPAIRLGGPIFDLKSADGSTNLNKVN